jgi:hypothetical protein
LASFHPQSKLPAMPVRRQNCSLWLGETDDLKLSREKNEQRLTDTNT